MGTTSVKGCFALDGETLLWEMWFQENWCWPDGRWWKRSRIFSPCLRTFSRYFYRWLPQIQWKCANCKPSFDTEKLRWRQRTCSECIGRVNRSEMDCEEVVSKEIEDGDKESRKKSVTNIMVTLTMLNNICQCPELDNQIIETLDGIIQKLQTLQLQKKKQHSYVMLYHEMWVVKEWLKLFCTL